MKNKKEYIAPTLKWYHYQPEVGFAGSYIINPNIHVGGGNDYTNGQQDWVERDRGFGYEDGGWDWD